MVQQKQINKMKEDIEQGSKEVESDEKMFGWWQLCPKCFGQGWVFCSYVTTNLTEQCDVCSGNKIIQRPLIDNQTLDYKAEAESEDDFLDDDLGRI